MRWKLLHFRVALRGFCRAEGGAAATQTGFALAAALGVAVVVLSLMLGGGRAAPEPVASLSPVDVAMAELMALPIRSFTPAQTRLRLERHIDPSQRTTAQLRTAHRIWARRVAEGSYVDPELAADMRAITEAALRIRGVSPHPDA